MGGVADERHPSLAPGLRRRTVAQHPHAPALDLAEQHPHRLAGLGEPLMQFRGIAETVPAFLVAVGVEHGDEIVEVAAAQRIDHQMHLLAGPEGHRPAAQMLRHLLRRQDRAVGDVAGDLWLAVTDDELPDRGPQPVGADQRCPVVAGPAVGARGHAVAMLVHRHDLPRRVQLDETVAAARLQQHCKEVGPVDERVGMRELGSKPSVERHPRHLLAGDGVEHDQVFGKDRQPADSFRQAQHVEHAEDVGPELNAGADFLELGSLFEHLRAHALLRQRERRRHAPDAAPDDHHRRLCCAIRHCFSVLRRALGRIVRMGMPVQRRIP